MKWISSVLEPHTSTTIIKANEDKVEDNLNEKLRQKEDVLPKIQNAVYEAKFYSIVRKRKVKKMILLRVNKKKIKEVKCINLQFPLSASYRFTFQVDFKVHQ